MSLGLPIEVPENAYDYGERSSGEAHGVVLTKPHVVELILDLTGYTTAGENLVGRRLLEPSCGHGAFLVPAARRLVEAAKRSGADPACLTECITAFDIDPEHVKTARQTVRSVLRDMGVRSRVAASLAEHWVRQGDFLLASIQERFDFVVGNPPYVRIEQISGVLSAEYRQRYRSLFDRADLYVAFIERGLDLLSPGGVLSYICADRWIRNRYGAPLRRIISSRFGLRCFIDLHTAAPFESEVIAYPSIFVLARGANNEVPVVTLETASSNECSAVLPALLSGAPDAPDSPGVKVARYSRWFEGDEPWVLSSPVQREALADLESRWPLIERSARVGIGVATGCDRIFIVGEDADVERDRLVPLVMRENIQEGQIVGADRYVINTFDDGGRAIDLESYPRLGGYLDEHGPEIRARHVARKNPHAWFRTIDRVYPDLVKRPKLLIPDIAGASEVAYDEGHYHPHHNLYFVVSDEWDMEVLGGLLSSRVALFFVWSYAVRMRGGYLRFQAQYLRRIRLPPPARIRTALKGRIRRAFRCREFAALDELALQAYGLEVLPPFDFVDTRR